MKKQNTYAVALKNIEYEIYGTKVTYKPGQHIAVLRRGNGRYINAKNELVIEHFFGYGQHEVFPADTFKLVTK